jgi:hypothetical protein
MPLTQPGLGRIILTHLIVGPPAGTLAFLAFTIAAGVLEGKGMPPSDGPWTIVNILPMAIAFGYVLGAIPAMVAGLFTAWVLKRTARLWHRLLAAPLFGALASWLGLFWVILGPNGGGETWVVAAFIGFTGAVAAFVSLLVALAMTPKVESR